MTLDDPFELRRPPSKLSMTPKLEDDYAPTFNQWKAEASPANNTAMLKILDPVLRKGVFSNTRDTNPIMMAKAKRIALDSLRTYDPSRARLQTHVLNNLQGLRREDRQLANVISAPEKVILDQRYLQAQHQELADTLGRDPVDSELADHTGLSEKRIAYVRGWRPGQSEGQLDQAGGNLSSNVVSRQNSKAGDLWLQLVYDDLAVTDKKIMEMTLGLNGQRKHSNTAIAAKLQLSPGAISQRKQRIQSILDQEQALSPF